MSEDLEVGGTRLITLPQMIADNGSLVVAEHPAGLPFVARRAFALFGVPAGAARGIHAHRECEQLLICLRGSVTALVDDGTTRREVVLDRPDLGLYMPALTWGTQRDYSADALLLVLASHEFDGDDYIHEYAEFQQLVAARN